MSFDALIALLDWFGVAVFATTGALVASRKEMDLVGFALLGTATGIGGGTVRDVLLGARPIFWVEEPRYVLVCLLASALTFVSAHAVGSRLRLLLWLDAVGLALFAVAGAERALASGTGGGVAVVMGVVTATFGGMIRDVLGGESPAILSREVYATAALVGAGAFVVLTGLGMPREVAVTAAVLAAFAIRSAALALGWSLPRYRPRPGRSLRQLPTWVPGDVAGPAIDPPVGPAPGSGAAPVEATAAPRPDGARAIGALVPELSVSDWRRSLDFYRDVLGFEVLYDRPEEGFAFVALGRAQIMLDQIGVGRDFDIPGAPRERPFGRGVNLQVEVAALDPILRRLQAARTPVLLGPEDRWYRIGDREAGQRQIVVIDPDGYLLRLFEALGDRPAAAPR